MQTQKCYHFVVQILIIRPNLSEKPGQAILTLPIPFTLKFCTRVWFYEYEEGLD